MKQFEGLTAHETETVWRRFERVLLSRERPRLIREGIIKPKRRPQ